MEAHFFVILAHWRLRQEDGEIEASLGCIVRACLKKKKYCLFVGQIQAYPDIA
jgi:hypothetical protein